MAGNAGGGMYMAYSNALAMNTTLSNNTAESRGGAVYVNGDLLNFLGPSYINLTKTVVKYNKVTTTSTNANEYFGGGGLYYEYHTYTAIRQSSFLANVASNAYKAFAVTDNPGSCMISAYTIPYLAFLPIITNIQAILLCNL